MSIKISHNTNYVYYYIDNISEDIMYPGNIAKPHYLDSHSRFIGIIFDNSSYNCEFNVFFPSKFILGKNIENIVSKQSSMCHALDAIQNACDVMGYLDKKIIKLDRIVNAHQQIHTDANEREYIRMDNVSIQSLTNIISLDTVIGINVHVGLKYYDSLSDSVSYKAQIPFSNNKDSKRTDYLYIEGTGMAYMHFNGKDLHDILHNFKKEKLTKKIYNLFRAI